MKDTGRVFLQMTKYANLSPSGESQGTPQPALELPYPLDARLIDLPKADELNMPLLDVRQAIEQRRSVRRYDEQPLTLAELSFLLWCTQGVKTVTKRPVTLRTVPSAGARHAFETYLLINRVEGVPAGLYRFLAIEHALLPLSLEEGLAGKLQHACFDQTMVGSSAVTFFWVAVTERMAWRYCERGYRYLFLDAGHVCQNLYLAAEAIESGVCAIAAYDDDLVNASLGLDGEELWCCYVAALGKKPC